MPIKFLAIIEKGEGNYAAYSPDVPGCAVTGGTVEQTLRELEEALAFHLEGLIEQGEPIPLPRSLNFYLEETDEISTDDIIAHIDISVSRVAAA
jgi:predicted RNase H-like HicB family nuclease